jgi:hypothetical protein
MPSRSYGSCTPACSDKHDHLPESHFRPPRLCGVMTLCHCAFLPECFRRCEGLGERFYTVSDLCASRRCTLVMPVFFPMCICDGSLTACRKVMKHSTMSSLQSLHGDRLLALSHLSRLSLSLRPPTLPPSSSRYYNCLLHVLVRASFQFISMA